MRGARGADTGRFALGIASGQPRADGMVLWTRLTGDSLDQRETVRWEVAADEKFQRIVARGDEIAEAAWGHSVHAEPIGLEPGRWYWYRFNALGEQSAAGRTRTAPAADAKVTLRFVVASCQRYDVNHYAAWRHAAAESPDFVLFLGDYIYESASGSSTVRRHEGTVARTLAEYRARYATYKSDPLLQAAHRAAPWLMVWDDHEVANDYANRQSQDLDPEFATRRAAAYQAYWEHMPFSRSARPRGPDMRIVSRLDWGALARIHLVDDRQYRDPQACSKPGRGGSNTIPLADCPALLDPRRSLLGFEQERWLAEGWDLARPWNLLGQQSLMARFAWGDPAAGTAVYWNDGWDGYAPSRNRLLGVVGERKVPGVVVFGGDVHSNYVADLKADFDDSRSPIVASEFCGTSISSLSLAQSRIDAVRGFNPHIHFGRSDQRGYLCVEVDPKQMNVRLQTVDRPLDPASGITTTARFFVESGRPGPHDA
ncbi:MAG: alkaline phosphatase D family protein [Caldimonas sp.]